MARRIDRDRRRTLAAAVCRQPSPQVTAAGSFGPAGDRSQSHRKAPVRTSRRAPCPRLINRLVVADRGADDDGIRIDRRRRSRLPLAGPEQWLPRLDPDLAILANCQRLPVSRSSAISLASLVDVRTRVAQGPAAPPESPRRRRRRRTSAGVSSRSRDRSARAMAVAGIERDHLVERRAMSTFRRPGSVSLRISSGAGEPRRAGEIAGR